MLTAALAALSGASCAHLTVVPVPPPPVPTIRAPRPAVGDFPPIQSIVPRTVIFPQVILRSSSLLVAQGFGGHGDDHGAGEILCNEFNPRPSTVLCDSQTAL